MNKNPCKAELRRAALIRRGELPPAYREQASNKIAETLKGCEAWRGAEVLFLYCGTADEVHTGGLIADALNEGKRVFLPKVVSETEMFFIEIRSMRDMAEGAYGIMEPIADVSDTEEEPGLIIVPCVAIDRRGNRIGHGRGYYDRYLNKYKDVPKICLAYDCQIAEDFEADYTDERIETIITETEVISNERIE